jgi:hypothetical protein
MSADRSVSVLCKHCGRRELVEVPDWRARQQAVAELLNRGYGRPGREAGAATSAPTLIRRIVLPGGRELEGRTAGTGLPIAPEIVKDDHSSLVVRGKPDQARARLRLGRESAPRFASLPRVNRTDTAHALA